MFTTSHSELLELSKQTSKQVNFIAHHEVKRCRSLQNTCRLHDTILRSSDKIIGIDYRATVFLPLGNSNPPGNFLLVLIFERRSGTSCR